MGARFQTDRDFRCPVRQIAAWHGEWFSDLRLPVRPLCRVRCGDATFFEASVRLWLSGGGATFSSGLGRFAKDPDVLDTLCKRGKSAVD